jgi:signal transduction histidine kinase
MIDSGSSTNPQSSSKVSVAGRATRSQRQPSYKTMAERVGALQEVILQVDAARGRDGIMEVLRHDVHWIVPHAICFACFLESYRSHYSVALLSTSSGLAAWDGRRLPVTHGTAGSVILQQSSRIINLEQGGSPPLTETTDEKETLDGSLRAAGMKSLLAVPLRSGQDTYGAMVFGAREPAYYDEEDLVIARLLATQVSIAFQNDAVFEGAQRRIGQIELVNELAEDLTSSLELEELLAAATETIRKTFKYYDVSVFLVDRENNEACLVAHSGVNEGSLPKGYRQKLNVGIIGWAITHDERVMVEDVTQDPRFWSNGYSDTRSELAIPIRVAHEIVGILNVEDIHVLAFDETDAIVLETLCDQLGSAVKNAQLFERLKMSNEKLKELDKMKSDFLGIVSHDFRSPLSSIILAAKALLKRPETADARRITEYMTVIVDQANKLMTLAEDTLSITRMEAGQLNYFFNMVSVERLIKDSVAMVNISKRHVLTYDIEPRAEYVRGDQTKLRQVLQNLVSNAVKYSPAGGNVSIHATSHSAEQLLVTVTDQGIGIPEDQIDHLFQKFSRINTPQAREIKGSGLGLWICREIVKAHGGQIWVESVPGKGSTFSFTLKKAHVDTILK